MSALISIGKAALGLSVAGYVVFHGAEDTTIPIDQGKALAARARSPVTFVTIDGADHAAGLFQADVIDRIERFLLAATP